MKYTGGGALVLLWVGCSQAVEIHSTLEFVEFPLRKIDYMYKEQSGPVAHVVFNLWLCTHQFLASNDTTVTHPAQMKQLKQDYHAKALPAFKSLGAFKRFIDELSVEWTMAHQQTKLRELFVNMFSRSTNKTYIDKLPFDQFVTVLQDLRAFLWDVAYNTPYTTQRYLQALSPSDRALVDDFVTSMNEQGQ